MIILDTNLWVFGTLSTNARAERILDEIEHGEIVSAINAYMIQEALDAFDRTPGLTAQQCDDVKTLFLTRLTRMTGLIEAPSSRDVADSLLDHRRSATHTQLLARITDLQAKDIPILIQRGNPALPVSDECSDQSEPRNEQGGSESCKLCATTHWLHHV